MDITFRNTDDRLDTVSRRLFHLKKSFFYLVHIKKILIFSPILNPHFYWKANLFVAGGEIIISAAMTLNNLIDDVKFRLTNKSKCFPISRILNPSNNNIFIGWTCKMKEIENSVLVNTRKIKKMKKFSFLLPFWFL